MDTYKSHEQDLLCIGGSSFSSRLLVGTGKFASSDAMRACLASSGAEIVTVALRRVELDRSLAGQDPIKSIDREKILILPNTSGARNAKEAVRLASLARELGGGSWVKLEVTPEPRYLLPDPVETFEAAQALLKEGFTVLPYIHADPVLALRLQDIGCATVMPLGSPIGSNQGLLTAKSIAVIIEQARVPVIVDAGIGSPSHAAQAMEMGADAVMVNTALAVSSQPAKAGLAFSMAVQAGRLAYLYGARGHKKERTKAAPAAASSPLANISPIPKKQATLPQQFIV